MEEIKQTIKGYLRIFFRRKWLLIIPAVAGLIFGVCAAIILPKTYRSSTTIMVQEGKSDNPLFNNLAVSSTMVQRANAVRETILGWDSLTTLVKRLHLDKDVKTNKDFEILIAKLRKEIEIEFHNNIIELGYQSSTPQQAQAVVKSVMDIFIEGNVKAQNKETADAIQFIEQQLHIYLGKIKSAEIAQAKDQLQALLVDSTEEHPTVKELRMKINKAMEELKKQNLEYSEDANLSAETTNPMINEIKKTLETMTQNAVSSEPARTTAPTAGSEKDLYKVMLIDRLGSVMARDIGVNAGIYNALLQRLETAKITQQLQSSKEGTKYIVLDPPRLPLDPIKPNKILVIFMGLVMGVVVGGGLIFACEFLDKSFLDVQEVSAFLGTPLLGTISKIVTPETLEAEADRTKWITFWLAASSILLISFTIMVHAMLKPA